MPLANFPRLFQVTKCEHFGSRQAKFIIQLDPISSDSPCHPVVPNFHFARQRERGELHRKVFWFEQGMVEFQQGFLSFLIEKDYARTMVYEAGTDLVTIR